MFTRLAVGRAIGRDIGLLLSNISRRQNALCAALLLPG
jgi:hypothetical protein